MSSRLIGLSRTTCLALIRVAVLPALALATSHVNALQCPCAAGGTCCVRIFTLSSLAQRAALASRRGRWATAGDLLSLHTQVILFAILPSDLADLVVWHTHACEDASAARVCITFMPHAWATCRRRLVQPGKKTGAQAGTHRSGHASHRIHVDPDARVCFLCAAQLCTLPTTLPESDTAESRARDRF